MEVCIHFLNLTFSQIIMCIFFQGDTHFVDAVAAYSKLPLDIQHKLDSLQGHFSYLKFRDTVPGVTEEDYEYMRKGWDHPLITIHPRTGSNIKFRCFILDNNSILQRSEEYLRQPWTHCQR